MILGVNPTLYIDQHLMSVWITEIVMFCYFVYYFLILGFTFVVFVRGHYRVLRETLTAICLTFFVSYPLFFLYPVEGPRWHFADSFVNDVQGPVFRQLVELIIENGAVRGGCVPSTHVAVALVILFACFRYYRRMAWILLPINIGLAVGTVWGRFHYVSDVVIGALIGTTCVLLVWKYYERWDTDKTREVSGSPRKMTHAT
jgi:membrane-associated phospholipid phosphatase